MLKISENLAFYRKKNHLTQSDVADHLGVTKASVSKWETGQTMPDVALLPLIASFYGVTLDELMGYEPMLTREQIRRVYQDYTNRFSEDPFEEVLQDLQRQIRRHYSCGPFLCQMVILLLNYIPTLPDAERQHELRNYSISLCSRIESISQDAQLRENARALRSMLTLQNGNYDEVINELSPLLEPNHMGQQNSLLILAYMSKGQLEDAKYAVQISLYQNLLQVLSLSCQYMTLQSHDPQQLSQTLHRMDALLEAYDIVHLHPNSASAYYYQAALLRILQGFEEEGIHYLELYVESVHQLFLDDFQIHGDTYFPCITDWFSESTLGNIAVRSKKDIIQTCLASFDHPALNTLDTEALAKLKNKLECYMQ